MKKLLTTLLVLCIIISSTTVSFAADPECDVVIDKNNQIFFAIGDTIPEYVCVTAQYDSNDKLLMLNYSYEENFVPFIHPETVLIKTYIWDNLVEMGNICTFEEKKVAPAKSIKIDFYDIVSLEKSGAGYTIDLYVNEHDNTKVSFNLSENTEYMINGEKTTFTNATLADAVKSGYLLNSDAKVELEFSSADKSKHRYDFNEVNITIYEDYVVKTNDTANMMLTADEDSPSSLSSLKYDGSNYSVVFTDSDGNAVSGSSIKKYDIITMAVTPYDWKSASDITSIKAVVTYKYISGSISSIDIGSSDNVYEVTINDAPYAASNALWLSVGEHGYFGLNAFDEIVSIRRINDNDYGIIIDSAVSSGIDENYMLKMYTSDGEISVYNMASRVKVTSYNGVNDTSTDTYEAQDAFALIQSLPVVCHYKLNSSGDINAIMVESEVIGYDADSTALVTNIKDETASIEAGLEPVVKASDSYYMGINTRIIAMNPDADSEATVEDFCIYSYDEFSDTNTEAKSVSVYGGDKDMYAGLVVIKDSSLVKEYIAPEVITESGYAVITNKGQTSGITEKYQIKMYTDKGELKICDLSKKVKLVSFDGNTVNTRVSSDEAYSMIPALPAVCKYEIKDDDTVYMLSFAESSYTPTESNALIHNELSIVDSIILGGKKPVIVANDTYHLTENTKIIAMNPDVDANSMSEEDFSVYSYDEFPAHKTNAASVSIYDSNNTNNAGFILISDSALIKENVSSDENTDGGYAVITRAQATSGFTESYQFKMYTTNTKSFEVITLADKVTVATPESNYRVTSDELFTDILNLINNAPILCEYQLNNEGKLFEISYSTTALGTVDSEVLVLNEKGDGKITAKGAVRLNNTYKLTDDTLIIAMDSDQYSSEDNFRIYNKSDFITDVNFSDIKVYNCDSNNNAGIIFISSPDISVPVKEEMHIVSTCKSVALNNMLTTMFGSFTETKRTDLMIDPDVEIPYVKGNVIIPVTYNNDNQVNKAITMIDMETGTPTVTDDFISYYLNLIIDGEATYKYFFGNINSINKTTISYRNNIDELLSGETVTVDTKLELPEMKRITVYDVRNRERNKIFTTYPAYINQFLAENNDDYNSYILYTEKGGELNDVIVYIVNN